MKSIPAKSNKKDEEKPVFDPKVSTAGLGVVIQELSSEGLCYNDQKIIPTLYAAGIKTLGGVAKWLQAKTPRKIVGIDVFRLEIIKLGLARLGFNTNTLPV